MRFYYELSFLRSEGAKILPEAVWKSVKPVCMDVFFKRHKADFATDESETTDESATFYRTPNNRENAEV